MATEEHETIEANSKPSAKKLQRYMIPDVATKWYELGLELFDEKEEHKLNIIKSNHGNDAKKCCLEMFLLWLENNNDATWYQIVEALKSPGVELSVVAVDLEKKLSVKSPVVLEAADQSSIESADFESLNFAEFKDVSLAFSALLSRLQKEIKVIDFMIIRNACVARASHKLSEQIKKTHDIDGLFQLFAENKAYCNWMNIRFLEVMANASGSSKLVNLVKNYKEVIYSKTLREVWDCIPYHTFRTKYYSRLQVKFDGKDPDNVTIEQLMRYCEPYVIKDIAMLIGVIEEESLKVTWLIPTVEVYNFYLATLMLPEESRIDSYLQIGDWIVLHPLKVLQSLHKEYPTVSPSTLLIGYYQSLLLKHVDADSLISKMCLNDLITSPERELILTGHGAHQRNQLLLELVRHRPIEAMMGFCECVQEASPKVGSQLVTALQSYVADEHHELISYTHSTITSSLGVIYSHPSSLHILFLGLIDQIEKILQAYDLSFLTKACESLLASKIHGISLFTTSAVKIFNEYNEAPLSLRYLRFLFTWSNHSTLKALVSFNSEAVQLLDKFDSLLYPLYPLVSYPIPSFSQDMIPSETSDYTLLSIRGNRELWASSLQYVFNVESFIVEVCEITQQCLQLLAVKSDPTMFYWTIPKCVVGLVKSNVLQHRDRLCSKGILEVAIGDDVIMESSPVTTENTKRRLKDTFGSSLTPYSYNASTNQLSIPNEEKTSCSLPLTNGGLSVPSFKRALSWQTGHYTSEQTDYYELSDYYSSELSKQAERIISKYENVSRSGIIIPRSSSPMEQPKEKNVVQNQISEVPQSQQFSKFTLDQSVLTLGQDGHYLEDRDYNIIRYAGAGGSAKCNFCNDKEKNTWFVVKRLGSLYKEDALKESQILQELDHDHVIRCYGAIEDLQDHCFKIFLEHANGTLGDIYYLFCKSDDKITYSGNIARVMLFVQQILLALDYLHREKNILHLDIKGKNIIVCNDGYKVKLIDFGTACKTDSISQVKSGWTPVYAAPEINRSEPPSFSADIWSAMCVAVEMVTGSRPWPDVTSDQQAIFTIGCYENDCLTELVQYSEYWDKYNDCPDHFDMYQELVNMWKMVFVKDRSCRPSASYLLTLKWMKEMELHGENNLYELVSGEKPEQSHSVNNESIPMIDQLSIHSSQGYVANLSYKSSQEYLANLNYNSFQPTHSYPYQSYPPPNILEPDEVDFAIKSYIAALTSYKHRDTSKSSSMPQLTMNRSSSYEKTNNLFNCRTRSHSLDFQAAEVISKPLSLIKASKNEPDPTNDNFHNTSIAMTKSSSMPELVMNRSRKFNQRSWSEPYVGLRVGIQPTDSGYSELPSLLTQAIRQAVKLTLPASSKTEQRVITVTESTMHGQETNESDAEIKAK